MGLDYFGPIIVKNGQSDQKVWICILTCLVTRAIDLELVGNLSTAEFLLCFKRFVAQRGTPSDVISDNAMCFRTANSRGGEISLIYTCPRTTGCKKALVRTKALLARTHINTTQYLAT